MGHLPVVRLALPLGRHRVRRVRGPEVRRAVIGVLAAIAIPQFAVYRRRGYDADVKSNIGNATISQEAYFTHKETYTSSLTDLDSWGFKQSANVNVAVSGTATTFTLTGTSTAACTANTGVWSFASSTGI